MDVSRSHKLYCIYSEFDIFSSSYLMLEYRWKVTLLSEGMLIRNCQQLFWRNPWLLWSLHPTECPNFDTESHGCGYLYILWENRFPPRNRLLLFSLFFSLLFFLRGYPTELGVGWRDNRKTHKTVLVLVDHTCCCFVLLFSLLSRIVGAPSPTSI